MKKGICTVLICMAALAVILGPGWSAVSQAAPAKNALLDSDCVKCHEGPPAAVAADGGAHKDVACTECHAGHRPASKNNIPQCADCHSGEPHYELKNCLECHKNPHTPLKIVLAAKLTDPCLSCHKDQIKQLKEFKSKHSALACTQCHNVHRRIPACVECHKPHEGMSQADCKKCHKAHQPMTLAYGAEVPNKDCAACHKKAMDLISATITKHKTVACVQCHKDKHRMLPDCQSCHPKPHPAGFMVKFPKCGDCHYIAHDLNNWPVPGGKKPAAAPAPVAPAPAPAAAPAAPAAAPKPTPVPPPVKP